MFESITEAILRHKQLVFAAIAITALAGYVVPLNQFAAATLGPIIIGDEGATDGATDGDTNVEDSIVQEGTATATGEQNPTITAPNTQTNAIVTGDATASQTNTATSRANAFSAAVGGFAIGGDGGDSCSDCDKKDPKKKNDDKKRDGSNGGDGGDGGFAIGGDAESDADATSSATVSGNTNVADTSADDNTQSNTNTQSFDLDLDQDVEAEVENEATQINDNYFNVEFDDLDLPF
jgi:hypothetical protein